MISWRQKVKLVFLLILEKLSVRQRTRDEVRLYNEWRSRKLIQRSKKAMKIASKTRSGDAQRESRRLLMRSNSKLKYAGRPPVEKDPKKFIEELQRPPKNRKIQKVNITPKD